VLAAGLVLIAACASGDRRAATPAPPALPPGAEAMSLLGAPLYPPPLPDERRAELERQLAEAYASHPDGSAERAIWVGRRLAYLGRHRDAIAAFTGGLVSHPGDARLLRHQGHRYVTIRRFDLAIADLERATALIAGTPDEVEPDGQPNARGIPIGTLHSNVWYHLGLAYYLTGRNEDALRSYRECMRTADNPDRHCSTAYWLSLTLRRLGRDAEARATLAPIRADWDLIENHAYHALLLVFRGDRPADDLLDEARKGADAIAFPTVGYGIAAWLALEGDRERAGALYDEILKGGSWAAFGFIAAEADVARSARTTPRASTRPSISRTAK
jgi:tetratricopeptide (TPR) repeat protein